MNSKNKKGVAGIASGRENYEKENFIFLKGVVPLHLILYRLNVMDLC